MNTEDSGIRDFDIALRMRDFEITQLTQRNNFFMIFQGVLFAGLIQSSHAKPVVSLLVCVAGLVIAFFQIGMASGAKFWQEYWEQVLSAYEAEARGTEARLFHDDKFRYEETVQTRLASRGAGIYISRIIMQRYSVSRIPIYVGIVLTVIWFLLVLCTIRGYPPFSVPSFVVGF